MIFNSIKKYLDRRITSKFDYNKKKQVYWSNLSYETIRRLCHYDLYNKTIGLNGDIVECGVAQGDTIIFLRNLQKEKKDNRLILALDSFEGFPKGTEKDADWFNALEKPKPRLLKYNVEYVKNRLIKFGLFDEDLKSIKFIKGFIPKTFKDYDFREVSLLNIDLDLYQPTKDVLNFFWPLMQEGGIMICDEYDFKKDLERWPGPKIAIDEFCSEKNIDLQRHFTGRVYLQKK